jgi:hypothetical protein
MNTISKNIAVSITGKDINLLEYWMRELHWPGQYFEPERTIWQKKSSSSLRRKQSEASSTIPNSSSNQGPREAKSASYTRPSYTAILVSKESFMDESELGVKDKTICGTLLEAEQTILHDYLFRADLFNTDCRKLQDRNEAKIIQDIVRLMVPSVETLATYSATHLDRFIESVNEGWNSARPFYGPRPQPD